MTLIDLLSSCWAILPEKLRQIQYIIDSHMAGGKLDLKAIEAKIQSITGIIKPKTYDSINGSAIINIFGVLSQNPSAFERVFFDAVSMNDIKSQIQAALSDESIDQIVLYINSPGGTVAGTQELANYIFENRGKKKIISYSDGQIASAAYWIGSAAEKIYLSGENTIAGSIGTIYRHVDISEQNKKEGVTITEFVSGQWKNAFSENIPLNQERTDYIQSIVDQSLSVFAADIKKFRGIDKDSMGEGRIFLGSQAIKSGLVDGFSSLDQIVNNSIGVLNKQIAGVQIIEGVTKMDINQLKSEHKELYDSVVSEIKEEFKAEIDIAYNKGKSDELERVKGIKAALIPGHESVINAMIENGSSVTDAQSAVIKAENEKRSSILSNLQNNSVPPVVEVPEVEKIIQEEEKKDFMQAVNEYRTKNNCSMSEALAEIASKFPDLHEDFLKNANGGKK